MKRIPDNLKQDYDYCLRLTRSHYENFPVASRLMPAHLQPHIAAIYAFARTADDFADESADRAALLNWRKELHNCLTRRSNNPIFRALAETIRIHQLPLEWLDDLLTAFLMDLEKNRYESLEDLLAYCRFSANPVGRLMLQLLGYREPELFNWADSITTALQLANFWQDISIDISKNRIYIPKDFQRKHGVSENQILKREVAPGWEPLMKELVNLTREMFRQGLPLLQAVNGRFKWELKFTYLGGLTILDKAETEIPNLLENRPVLKKSDWLKIALKSLVGPK
ncbi:MAG: squalene synthase HpnC [Calditrichia bacterium]